MKKTLIIILAIFTLYSCEKEYNDISSEKSTEKSSSSPSLLKSMTTINGTKTVTGQYYWKLLFNYDNTTNTAPITVKFTLVETKSFQTKTFVKETFSLSSGYKLDTKTSVNLKFLGDKVTGSIGSDYSYHVDLAKALEETYEATSSSTITKTYDYTYNVGAGGKLAIYQLVFTSPFGRYETQTTSTSPTPIENVYIDFDFTEEILGFEDMMGVLLTTFPGSQNTVEWASIRNNIVTYSSCDDHTRFYNLLLLLRTITPGSANKAEWANIRQTCNEILNDWNTVNRNALFRKLLARFRVTVPGKDNKAEWQRIREKATSIYTSTVQVW